ncbi:MAG: hypothetical protein RLZZ01_638 [Actinomycetota bacterium]
MSPLPRPRRPFGRHASALVRTTMLSMGSVAACATFTLPPIAGSPSSPSSSETVTCTSPCTFGHSWNRSNGGRWGRPRRPRPTTTTSTTTTLAPTTTAAPTTTTAPPTTTTTTAPPTTTTTTAPPTTTTTTAPPTTTTTTTAPPTTTTTTTTTVPPTTTTTTTVPVSSGFPTAATTGVPAGTVLRSSGSLTITTPGTTIDGLDITGSVTINASNVTIRRSRITGSAFALIRVASNVTGVRIEDVEIDGRGTAGQGNSMGVYGPATVVRSNIHGVENGVTPFSGSVVTDNYIHGLSAPGSPHYDGIQIDGGASNIRIERNTIDMREHSQTATVMIDNYFGPTDNILVNGNRLLGGGYTVYSDGQFSGGPITNVTFSNNRMGRGYWGYASIVRNSPVWTGNVDDVTGQTIPG